MTTKLDGRINSLDYLRGLAALGVMIYHVHLFTYGEIDASSILAKIKIYGVTIFFVLSGLTLYKVHVANFSLTKPVLIQFYIKRFFRIVPLLWLVTLLTFIFYFQPEYLTIKKTVANITIIPGAIKPETFIARGAWSIGDELFFYMLFPFLLWLAKFKKWLFFCFTAASLIALCCYCFYKLNPGLPLGSQWAIYVAPLGHAFYFLSGIALGVVDGNKKFGSWPLFAIVVVYLLIAFYPISGEPIVLVTGVNHLVLSGLIISLCYLFYKCDFSFLPGWLKLTLHTLGAISYSVYLLHPVVHSILQLVASSFFKANPVLLMSLTAIITLILSYFMYNFFELYFIKVGKTLTLKFKEKQQQLKSEVW